MKYLASSIFALAGVAILTTSPSAAIAQGAGGDPARPAVARL